jgi:hypothetical protein
MPRGDIPSACRRRTRSNRASRRSDATDRVSGLDSSLGATVTGASPGVGPRRSPRTTVEGSFEDIPQVRQQVPAIGHLDRIGRRLVRGPGVGRGPIAADDLDTGMLAQPAR